MCVNITLFLMICVLPDWLQGVMFVWLMDNFPLKAESRFSIMEHGEQCVIITGTEVMLWWCAGN